MNSNMHLSPEIGQRRAKAGGEYGANGDWYEGGKFIATKDSTVKSAPVARRELTPEEMAEQAARKAREDAEQARHQAWIAPRLERFASLVARLTARPWNSQFTEQEWPEFVKLGHGGFLANMGLELARFGRLSPRQALPVVEIVHGRRTKKNAETFDALLADLTEEAPE